MAYEKHFDKIVVDVPVYEDVTFDTISLATGAGTPPDIGTLDSTGIELSLFARAETVSGSMEIPHDYKEGTDISFHIHALAPTIDAANEVIQFQLEYVWYAIGDTISSSTTINLEHTVLSTDTAWTSFIITSADISGSGKTMGSQFAFKLTRNNTGGDTYTGSGVSEDVAVNQVGVHYQKDSLGSTSVLVK